MATVTIEPVAWRGFVQFSPGQSGWRFTYSEDALISQGIHRREPLYTADALATARAEGKAEGLEAGMRKAAERIKPLFAIDDLVGWPAIHAAIVASLNSTADAIATARAEGKAEGMRDAADTQRTLVAFIMQMSRYLPQDNEWRGKSVNYLKSKGLLPSPFRAAAIPAPQETLASASPNREGRE